MLIFMKGKCISYENIYIYIDFKKNYKTVQLKKIYEIKACFCMIFQRRENYDTIMYNFNITLKTGTINTAGSSIIHYCFEYKANTSIKLSIYGLLYLRLDDIIQI